MSTKSMNNIEAVKIQDASKPIVVIPFGKKTAVNTPPMHDALSFFYNQSNAASAPNRTLSTPVSSILMPADPVDGPVFPVVQRNMI